MKNRFNKQLFGAVLLSLSLFSCSDFLDKLPENSVEAESVDYTNLADMYMPVSGTYATYRVKASSWSFYGLINVRGDDVEKGSSATDQIEYNYCKFFQYDKINSFWALNGTWEGLYNVVSTANAALLSLDKYAEHISTDADRNCYEQYAAEIRYLRAQTYFYLVNLWGNVPLLLDNQALNIEKTPREEVVRYIYDELDYCIAHLPAIRPNEAEHPGAVTKYTALALKAKLKMYNNEWEDVLAATNQIIASGKFSLYPDFYQLFKIPGKLCEESLFEIQLTDFGNGSGDIVQSDNWFAFQGPRVGTSPISGWGFMTPTDEIRALFHARGETVRDTTTFLLTDAVTPSGDVMGKPLEGEPTAYAGKAYTPSNQMTPGRTNYGDNNNIRVMRYADVLLMNAEAKVRLGQNGDAPLNLVRERAGMHPISGATVEQILEERRVELAMEWGERFFDLVRTGLAATTLPGFVSGQSEYYPIPLNQIDLNPNLK